MVRLGDIKMKDNELNEEILTFVCERIDKIINKIKFGEKYIEYKSNSEQLFKELEEELTEVQIRKIKKLLDSNFKKESYIEEMLYIEAVKDGIKLERKFND